MFSLAQHAATQHELSLHAYYTSLIAQLQSSHSSSTLLDSTTLSTLLVRLSGLIRAALRSVNGEETSEEDKEYLGDFVNQMGEDGKEEVGESAGALPEGLIRMLSGLEKVGKVTNGANIEEGKIARSEPDEVKSAPIERTSTIESEFPPTNAAASSSTLSRTQIRLPSVATLNNNNKGTIGRWMGDVGTSGGYHGNEGRADWAIEREEEILRLEEENKMLRKLLGVDLDLAGMKDDASGGSGGGGAEVDSVAIAAAKEEGRRQSEEIQAMKDSATYREGLGLASERPSASHHHGIFSQGNDEGKDQLEALAQEGRKDLSQWGSQNADTTSSATAAPLVDENEWREDLIFTNPDKEPDVPSSTDSTSTMVDVPLVDIALDKSDFKSSAVIGSPPRSRSPIRTSSPRIPTPPSPTLSTSPTFSRSQHPSNMSRSPKTSSVASRLAMLSPTNKTSSLPGLTSPQASGSGSLRGSPTVEGGIGSPNSLASIFVKPKTDPTTATTIASDPALEIGDLAGKEGNGPPMLARSTSSPAGSGALGLGVSSVPSPLGSSSGAAGSVEAKRTASASAILETAPDQREDTDETGKAEETPEKFEEL